MKNVTTKVAYKQVQSNDTTLGQNKCETGKPRMTKVDEYDPNLCNSDQTLNELNILFLREGQLNFVGGWGGNKWLMV